MTTPNQPGNITYKVVGTSDGQYGPDAAGNSVEGHKVYFRLNTGQSDNIFVTDTQWPDAALVEDLVKQAATHLARINGLTGTVE